MLKYRVPCLARRPSRQCRHFSQSAWTRLQLAFDRYDPPFPQNDKGAIVFLHGLFGSKRNNRTMSKILARDLNRSVYALDLRNHGDSPHDAQHDYASMATDVESFLSEHALSNSTLMGHSMGAKVAMTVALRQHHSVKNLVCIDNAPIDAALGSKFGQYIQAMRRIQDAKITRQSDADTMLKDYEDDLGIRQFLLSNLVKTSGQDSPSVYRFRIPIDTLGKALDKMADFPFRDPEITRWNGDALFVRGTKSRYVADESLPVIGRFFPRFQVRDIEAGHWVVSENPEAFRAAVVDFLQDG